ncbi:MAG: DUF565 domain-containing protein [Synechococcus sp.]|nr:DUF565 domain-containing protein [Synechococcus sp.]
MVLQQTRYERLQRQLGNQIRPAFVGPWKHRSVGAIALLVGFFLGSNLTTYYLEKIGQRPLVVLALVLLIELTVRMRSQIETSPWPMRWLVLDNLRLGVLYAVVLEAFKLGS